MKGRLFTRAILTALACLCSSVALAVTSTTTFQVSASVPGACDSFTATSLSFGDYNPLLSSSVSATSSINVTCTSGRSFSIALDGGTTTGGGVSQRKMTDGTNTLNYNLYTTSDHSNVWGDSSNDSVSDTGTGAQVTETVYGSIPASQTSASQGSYSDTITATITY